MDIHQILSLSPVIPVLTIRRADDAVPLAQALVGGGLRVLEVTLRTDAALESIRRIVSEVPEAVVGAGTVTRPVDLSMVRAAGGRFAVSPGLTEDLARAASEDGLPLLPGIMTPSEAMAARALGFHALKLFPAKVAGGVGFLKALHGPLPDLVFCPTGGIGRESFREYLTLPYVPCVGGSWVAPKDAVAEGRWDQIRELARDASGLPRSTGSGAPTDFP
ncbi:MAG: bifunctional 4-hydroxy-2-oxoglutarate aldolase/2-dehydro-3-deoxy-phosphogluconate aldolase [Acidobacteriota bacterium]